MRHTPHGPHHSWQKMPTKPLHRAHLPASGSHGVPRRGRTCAQPGAGGGSQTRSDRPVAATSHTQDPSGYQQRTGDGGHVMPLSAASPNVGGQRGSFVVGQEPASGSGESTAQVPNPPSQSQAPAQKAVTLQDARMSEPYSHVGSPHAVTQTLPASGGDGGQMGSGPGAHGGTHGAPSPIANPPSAGPASSVTAPASVPGSPVFVFAHATVKAAPASKRPPATEARPRDGR